MNPKKRRSKKPLRAKSIVYRARMGELRFTFDSRKSAQAAAFLLNRAGGSLTKGFLVKMLYAADRRQLRRIGVPITGDSAYSMENGPILSAILNLLNGTKKDNFWGKHVSTAAQETHAVRLLAAANDDLLSENEKESLAKAFDFFGSMSWKELKAFFHDPKNFPEWEDPGTSRIPISAGRILKKAGKPSEFINELTALQKEEELISRLLA